LLTLKLRKFIGEESKPKIHLDYQQEVELQSECEDEIVLQEVWSGIFIPSQLIKDAEPGR